MAEKFSIVKQLDTEKLSGKLLILYMRMVMIHIFLQIMKL